MQEGQPSHTALRVAMRRAAHQLLDQPPVFRDPLALPILGNEMAAALRSDAGSFERGRVSPFLRAFFAARSRMAEDQLAGAVAGGLRQYVILGAGLDTFAYRSHQPELRVFEVDHPATQGWKRQRLLEAGIKIPAALTFVPVDFEHDDLAVELARAGCHPDQPVFFAWLGVTPYLKREAAMTTLRTIARMAIGGGGVVFDYGVDPDRLNRIQRMVFDAMAARVSAAGEPWLTFFDPDRLVDDLRAIGFSDVSDAGPEALNRLYFAGRSDGLRVGSLGRIMTAWVRTGRSSGPPRV
ncbi:MAG: class I SAM-dependent methyltransferase [Acidobacteriota bacterium]